MTSAPTLTTALSRGLGLRCPACGEGALYSSYLKQVETCAQCGESFREIRADDMAASPTIFVTALIALPLLVFLEHDGRLSDGAIFAIVAATALATALAVLPRAKSLIIAAVWKTSRSR
jgi:uncharacterized protein (DUF983 family)